MKNDLSPKNSLKSVLTVFAGQLLCSIKKISYYEIIGNCGIGSNGIVYIVKSESDNELYALKIPNLSYYLISIFELNPQFVHESAFEKFDEIIQTISNTTYKTKNEDKMVQCLFYNENEKKSYMREYLALKRLPQTNNTVYMVDYGCFDLHSYFNVKDCPCHNTWHLSYFVMPYFQGITLSDYITKPSSDIERWNNLTPIFGSIIDIIQTVHNCNIIHRDLYSNNFLFNIYSKNVFLIDFGSSIIKTIPNLDAKGERRGARRFMSPEQFADPTSVNFQSDYFFIGSLLFYFLTLKTPFSRERTADTLPPMIEKYLNRPENISEIAYSKLVSFCNRLLQYESRERFQSIEDIKESWSEIENALGTP